MHQKLKTKHQKKTLENYENNIMKGYFAWYKISFHRSIRKDKQIEIQSTIMANS